MTRICLQMYDSTKMQLHKEFVHQCILFGIRLIICNLHVSPSVEQRLLNKKNFLIRKIRYLSSLYELVGLAT